MFSVGCIEGTLNVVDCKFEAEGLSISTVAMIMCLVWNWSANTKFMEFRYGFRAV